MYENMNKSQEVALRREARRRKILENSSNRLKLIEGIKSGVDKSPSQNFSKLTAPEVKISDNNQLHHVEENNGVELDLNLKFEDIIKENNFNKLSEYLIHNEKENEERNNRERKTDVENELEQGTELSFVKIVLKKRLHYIFLAFFVNILLHLNLGYLFYDNIFLPFYTIKIIEILSRKEGNQELQPFFFILLATLPIRIQEFSKLLFNFLSALFSDLLLYIFFFIIGTKTLNMK